MNEGGTLGGAPFAFSEVLRIEACGVIHPLLANHMNLSFVDDAVDCILENPSR